MDEEKTLAWKVGHYVGNAVTVIFFFVLAVVLLVNILALLGAGAAIVVESYQWFRETLSWV